jgi:DNA-binding transcriptional MerR regulator
MFKANFKVKASGGSSMKIGELAKRTGLAASRIRFYESAGLLHPVPRQANGYRDYPPESASVLEIIDSAQRAGFSLEQVRRLLPLGGGSWDHDALLVALKAKVAEIEALMEHLRQSRTQLMVAIDSIESRVDSTSCGDNRTRVLEQLRGKGVVASRRKSAT